MGAGAIFVIIIFGVPVALFLIVSIFFTLGISFSLLGSGTEHNNVSANFRKRRKYNADDFYDEPDGFYVTMADGSVRIDD